MKGDAVEYDEWLNNYAGNLMEFKSRWRDIEYTVDLRGLCTEIADGMYQVQLPSYSGTKLARHKLCIVDGMVVLETLIFVIEDYLEVDQHHTGFEGVQQAGTTIELVMAS